MPCHPIGAFYGDAASVTMVDYSENEIHRCASMARFQALRMLDVSDNNLRDLEVAVQAC